MKKSVLLLLAIAGTFGLSAQTAALKSSLDSVNYAYGMTTAAAFKKVMDQDGNLNLFLAGLNAALNGNQTQMTTEAANKRFNEYNTKVSQPRVAAHWKDDNAKFLEENKKRAGVVTTSSGLQYEIMHKGTGTVSPKATDRVEVHYHGTLIDGQIFDSSVNRGKTSSFGLNQVIPGWTEGLQYMKEGDKFKFFIPYNLAYGEQGRGATIKGYSTLIFEVELFKVMPTDAPAAQPSAPPASGNEKAAGQKFLEENKKRPGVVTTASGLQYEILKKGTGTVSPKATDRVEVHYHGTLLNGQVFDSSVQRGEPITFGLNQVIPGWTEGVQLMKEGDKFKFYIPNELAYGERSPGAGIPAGAALIFEVELLRVNPK